MDGDAPEPESTSSAGVTERPLPVEDIRVARCLSKAIETFEGDWEKAAEWMHTPNLSLDQRKPFEVALDSDGDQRVIAVLVRIDHGVYT